MTSDWQKKLRNEDPLAALAAMSGVNNRQPANTDQMATVIPLGKIRTDGGTQPRAKLDQAIIDAYAEDMLKGDIFPPVIVFYDGTNYWLADGFHRVYAARKAGVTALSAEVRQGRQREAILYSVGVNATHGLRRTNADKRRAVMTLLEDKEWSAWSDREIARQCKVSHTFAGNLRDELSVNSLQIEPDEPEARTVLRGGQVYEQRVSSDKRQAAAVERYQESEKEDPVVSAREKILDALAAGPLSPVELRQKLQGVPNVIYEIARDALYQEGVLEGERDVRSGRTTYRLAGQTIESAETPSTDAAPLLAHVRPSRLGVNAHSQDHDADLAAAYTLRGQLERAALDAIDALDRLLDIQGIRILHRLTPGELGETDAVLLDLLGYVCAEGAADNPAARSVQSLRGKLAAMAETGQPYDAEADEEDGR